MKTIILVRHAKSSWKNLALNDIDRPLKKRGILDAQKMANYLKSEELGIEVIFSSPATRAFETAKIMVDELNLGEQVLVVVDKLYLPSFSDILKFALYLDDKKQTIAIIGHEPSLLVFIQHFLKNSPKKLSTSSSTTLRFDTKHWSSISSTNLVKAWHRSRNDFNSSRLI